MYADHAGEPPPGAVGTEPMNGPAVCPRLLATLTVNSVIAVGSEPVASHGFEQSVRLTVPPLACVYLKRRA